MWKLLIVDDEPILADSLYYYLKRHQGDELEVMRVYSGEEAMRLLATNKFDLVISDICMPGLDGLQLLDIIKRLWPGTRVIMLTGHRKFDYIYTSMQYEGVRYLMKSERFEDIFKAIQEDLSAYEQSVQGSQQLALLRQRVDTLLPLLYQSILGNVLTGSIRLTQNTMKTIQQAGIRLNPDLPLMLILGRIDTDITSFPGEDSAMLVDNVNVLLTACIEHIKMTLHFYWQSNYIAYLLQTSDSCSEQQTRECYAAVYQTLPDVQLALDRNSLPMMSFFTSSQPVSFEQLPAVWEHFLGVVSSPSYASDGMITQIVPLSVMQPQDAYLPLNSNRAQRMAFFLSMGKRDHFLSAVDACFAEPNMPRSAIRQNMHIIASLLFSELGKLPCAQDTFYDQFEALCSLAQPLPDFLAFVRGTLDYLYAERTAISNSEKDNVVNMINQFIELHYAEDLPLIRIADFAGYNSSYLSRLYKLKTGENISAHINHLRIHHAQRLLRETDSTVGTIGRLVGVDSPKYFSSLFKNETGMTPQQYRAQTAAEGDEAT